MGVSAQRWQWQWALWEGQGCPGRANRVKQGRSKLQPEATDVEGSYRGAHEESKKELSEGSQENSRDSHGTR